MVLATAIESAVVAARQLSSSSIAVGTGTSGPSAHRSTMPNCAHAPHPRVRCHGTVLMAIGAPGAGARPVVQDPTFGVRESRRASRPSADGVHGRAVDGAGVDAGPLRFLGIWSSDGETPRRMMSRAQLDRTSCCGSPLLIAPPMYSRRLYSYLAPEPDSPDRAEPTKVGPALPGLGLDHVFTLSGAEPVAETGALRAAVPDRYRHLREHHRRALPPARRPHGVVVQMTV